LLVLLSGIGPVIPWRRASLAGLRRHLLAPLIAAMIALAVLLALGAGSKPSALVMFCCAAFAITVVVGELWRGASARMAMAAETAPIALLHLVQRNRRRYGGYTVHVGIAVLLIGVAASSSFEHQTQRSLGLGQSARVGAYTVRYARPTAAVVKDPAHTGSTLNLGAVLEVSSKGRHVATLTPSRGYYESPEASAGSVGHLIAGQAVSHISMDSGLTRNVWSAIEPNIQAPSLARVLEAGNRVVPMGRSDEALLALAVLARDYLAHPPPAQFNLITAPLVEWIWLGGLIVLLGALIAIWPAPLGVRRRLRLQVPAGALDEQPARGLAGA
jgi:cytochrome c-type biogenesis protein CcmF